jgi:hypothetical protein
MSETENTSDGLAAKNAQLLHELKVAKAKLRDYETTATTPEQYKRLQDDFDRLLEENVSLKKNHGDLSKLFEETNKKFAKEVDLNHSMMREHTISSQMTSANIAAPYQKAVAALLMSRTTVVDDGGNRVVKIDGKDPGDFFKEWSSTEDAKHFIAAPANTGSGTVQTSGTPKQTQKTIPLAEFLRLSPMDQMNMHRTGVQIT